MGKLAQPPIKQLSTSQQKTPQGWKQGKPTFPTPTLSPRFKPNQEKIE